MPFHYIVVYTVVSQDLSSRGSGSCIVILYILTSDPFRSIDMCVLTNPDPRAWAAACSWNFLTSSASIFCLSSSFIFRCSWAWQVGIMGSVSQSIGLKLVGVKKIKMTRTWVVIKTNLHACNHLSRGPCTAHNMVGSVGHPSIVQLGSLLSYNYIPMNVYICIYISSGGN